jgi:hypothetical protein
MSLDKVKEKCLKYFDSSYIFKYCGNKDTKTIVVPQKLENGLNLMRMKK